MVELWSTSKWVWIDYSILGVLLISSVTGLLRGFIKEVLALFTWIAAIWVGIHFCHELSSFLESKIAFAPVRVAVAFAVLFFATLLLGGLIGILLNHFVERGDIGFGDRMLGMGLGFVKGMVLILALVLLAGFTALPEQSWWKQSQLISLFQILVIWLKDHMPANLAGYVNYR